MQPDPARLNKKQAHFDGFRPYALTGRKLVTLHSTPIVMENILVEVAVMVLICIRVAKIEIKIKTK
jgi:hypothetical protein